ncbi:hypothetical protein C8F04DRAFT_1192785 [Mycena alexandri]|uniref:Uncharacterized protein n=1 Tax=Mycena alexandri TaxID=1745969 RepID=A0AAD6WUM4_9AGAR|nr:hypothetical protein C8F04DRAFT_1192785 [Mycena alexandri]
MPYVELGHWTSAAESRYLNEYPAVLHEVSGFWGGDSIRYIFIRRDPITIANEVIFTHPLAAGISSVRRPLRVILPQIIWIWVKCWETLKPEQKLQISEEKCIELETHDKETQSRGVPVERELGFWKTGSSVPGKGTSSQFSFDNWGDIKTRDGSRVKLKRRAMKFLVTLKTWTPENWAELEAEAEEWLEVKKRFASSSRGSSEAGDTEIFEESESDEVIIVSD